MLVGGRLNSRILRPVRVNANGDAQCDSRKKRRTASFQVLFHKPSKLLELSWLAALDLFEEVRDLLARIMVSRPLVTFSR